VALFYRTNDEFTAGVLEFLRPSLRGNQPILIAGTGTNLRFLRRQLDGYAGRVSWEELPDSGINPRRITAAFRLFADEHAGQAVVGVQELAWPTQSPENLREMLRHEASINLALAHDRASVLCAFNMQLPAGLREYAERTHPMTMRNGLLRESPLYAADGSVIPAECDEPLPPPPATAARLVYRESLAAVRRFAAAEAERAGLEQERVADLVMAVSELAANTLAHTSGPGTVTMWAAGGEIVGQVEDSGLIIDPLAGIYCPDPTKVSRGHGLWVVHQLCDLVETRTGPRGTTTRVHMRLPS
jgi:anti-sigma regulatory factor (Ser/Thr protein kinase)